MIRALDERAVMFWHVIVPDSLEKSCPARKMTGFVTPGSSFGSNFSQTQTSSSRGGFPNVSWENRGA